MKTLRNKSFLSHLLGCISGEESDDMDTVAKKWWRDGGGDGVGGFILSSNTSGSKTEQRGERYDKGENSIYHGVK